MRLARRWGALLGIIALLLAGAGSAEPWSAAPWLADLAQMRDAVATRYANHDWLEARGLTIPSMFDRAADQMREAGSDAEAHAVFDRLVRRFADGHVEMNWPTPAAPRPPAARLFASLCDEMGFDASQSSAGIVPLLDGYAALPGTAELFPAGLIRVAGKPVGVIRIGVFQPQGSPALCHAAMTALKVAQGSSCNDRCQDGILSWTYARMTEVLAERLEQLKQAGATALIIDVSDNGGGTEWVEAAARMVTPVRLQAEPLGFVRGAQWMAEWSTVANQLRTAKTGADAQDGARLDGLIAQAEAAGALSAAPCTAEAACIGKAGFATGLVESAAKNSFAGKGWAPLVFSPAQYPYREGVWDGPLVVLVDDETWSAAEEFAAELQDNHAAIIVGQRTGGAGCGHTTGSEAVTLAHSGGELQLPDCIRFRADGSNEVRGVIPDVLVGLRGSDRPRLEARLLAPFVETAVQRAEHLQRR